MGRVAVIAVLVIALLGLAGCGSSSSSSGTSTTGTNGGTSQSNSTVCSAVSDIKHQVKKLQGVTNGSVSPTEAAGVVQALETDLATIKTQAMKTSGTTRQNLMAANAAFARQLNSIAQSVTGGSSTSISAAATKLATAAQQLGSSYKAAFANMGC